MSEPLERSIAAAVPRISNPTGHGVENALLNSIFSLQAAAQPLMLENYVAAYEAGGAEFYVRFDSNASSFYAQLHATLALAAALVAGRGVPPLAGVSSLHGLETTVSRHPGHPLAAQLRTRRREIGLLRWLGRVRNKVVQHRVKSGNLRASAILANDGIAFVRTSAARSRAGAEGPIAAHRLQPEVRKHTADRRHSRAARIPRYRVPLSTGVGRSR